MKIEANSIRVGNVLSHNGRLCVVLKTMHTQPGKGGAYMQVEMKDIQSGTKFNERFRSSESVEKAHIESRDLQYLYVTGDRITLMDMESYEQIDIDASLIGELTAFLADGMKLVVQFYDNVAVLASLPEKVTCVVTECETAIKGQTATSSYKSAILDNGIRIMVPQFLDQGEKIVVNTNTLEYLERA